MMAVPCWGRPSFCKGVFVLEEKRSVFSNALIWFGASVSLAEIYTGTLLAPLGFARGAAAMALGHIAGGLIMYLAALIGGLSGRGAMESVKLSFGGEGAKFFAALNVLQLIGWTAVMIIGGALSLGAVLNPMFGTRNDLWCAVIGLAIAFWVMLDMKNFERVSRISMALLFVLSLVLTFLVFTKGSGSPTGGGTMSFSSAMELSAAMPLSWLPLVSDYMRNAEEPRRSAAVSTAVYTLGSFWMYLIGLGVALYTGGTDVARIMQQAGLGGAGVLIVIFSTVTTTFLDAWSGGISAHTIFPFLKEKAASIAICAAGTVIAIFARAESYEGMLYYISSVFAPMAAVMIADFFILKKNYSDRKVSIRNMLIWGAGFALYRYMMTVEIPLGPTLPVIAVTIIIAAAVDKFVPQNTSKN